jgi:selenide,water dikinase
LAVHSDSRILTGLGNSEDAAIVRFPAGKALVQTVDFFTPIVNDPFLFGQIAAANSLSDVYAMGGQPYVAMNIVCFPAKTMDTSVLAEILRGGLSKIEEAGALLVGGHSVQDSELKYGLSVSGIIDPDRYATNAGLRLGDKLVLTKPIGSGVLATAIKAEWEGAAAYEHEIWRWAARLNRFPGEAIGVFALEAATDVTGFGLGGHLLEMARASDCSVRVDIRRVPLMAGAQELAGMGLIPAGSFANKHFCRHEVQIASGADAVLLDLMFDAQTSGGMILAIDERRVEELLTWLEERGELAVVVGDVHPARTDGVRLALW